MLNIKIRKLGVSYELYIDNIFNYIKEKGFKLTKKDILFIEKELQEFLLLFSKGVK